MKPPLPRACVVVKQPDHPHYIPLGFNGSCVYARCTTSGSGSVGNWHELRLKQLNRLVMEAGGGQCSTVIAHKIKPHSW